MPVPGGAVELAPRRPLRGLGARDPCAGRRRGGGRGRPSGTTAGLGTCSCAPSRRPGVCRPLWRRARVGTGETSRPGGTHTYPPCPAPAAGDAHGATDGNDRALRSACATGPEAHGGDRRDRPRHVGPPLLRRPRKDAAGDADRRLLPRHATLLEGDRRGDGGRRARDPRPTGATPGADRACQTAEAMRDACGWATAEEAEPMPGGVSGWTAYPNASETGGRQDGPGEGIFRPPRRQARQNAYLEGANSPMQSIKKAARALATWSTTTLRSSPG